MTKTKSNFIVTVFCQPGEIYAADTKIRRLKKDEIQLLIDSPQVTSKSFLKYSDKEWATFPFKILSIDVNLEYHNRKLRSVFNFHLDTPIKVKEGRCLDFERYLLAEINDGFIFDLSYKPRVLLDNSEEIYITYWDGVTPLEVVY